MDSSLVVQGKTYYNVAKFDIDMDDIWYSTQQYPNAIYYWAKDVGLIKRWNKTENFSWEPHRLQYHQIENEIHKP